MIPAASVLLALRSKAAPIPQVALTEAGFGITLLCQSITQFSLSEAIQMAAAAGVVGLDGFRIRSLVEITET